MRFDVTTWTAWLRSHRWALTAVGFSVAVATWRIALGTVSSFGPYHGFNEAWYASTSFRHWLVVPVRPDGVADLNVGPLTAWVTILGQSLFGGSEAAARSLHAVSLIGTGTGAYLAAGRLWSPRAGALASMLAVTAPWVLLWSGRAQAEPWLTACVVLTVAALVRRGEAWARWVIGPTCLLGVLSKPTFLMVLPALGIATWRDPRISPGYRPPAFLTYVSATAGLALGSAWWGLAWIAEPDAARSTLLFHSTSRAVPFEAWAEVLVLGGVVAAGILIMFIWRRRQEAIVWLPVVTLFAFALLNAPHAHSYYTAPMVPLIAVLAAGPLITTGRWLPALAVAGNGILAGVTLDWAGDTWDTRLRDAAESLDDKDLGRQLFTIGSWVPQLEYYTHADWVSWDPVREAVVSGAIYISPETPPGCVGRGRAWPSAALAGGPDVGVWRCA